mmetsp:Transcript_13447/g.24053  ORF Transcript_13447/g.24053 Transcript_13447/m.24053 type:complete len:950 (-) Transcript_13447:1062-3911(-)
MQMGTDAMDDRVILAIIRDSSAIASSRNGDARDGVNPRSRSRRGYSGQDGRALGVKKARVGVDCAVELVQCIAQGQLISKAFGGVCVGEKGTAATLVHAVLFEVSKKDNLNLWPQVVLGITKFLSFGFDKCLFHLVHDLGAKPRTLYQVLWKYLKERGDIQQELVAAWIHPNMGEIGKQLLDQLHIELRLCNPFDYNVLSLHMQLIDDNVNGPNEYFGEHFKVLCEALFRRTIVDTLTFSSSYPSIQGIIAQLMKRIGSNLAWQEICAHMVEDSEKADPDSVWSLDKYLRVTSCFDEKMILLFVGTSCELDGCNVEQILLVASSLASKAMDEPRRTQQAHRKCLFAHAHIIAQLATMNSPHSYEQWLEKLVQTFTSCRGYHSASIERCIFDVWTQMLRIQSTSTINEHVKLVGRCKQLDKTLKNEYIKAVHSCRRDIEHFLPQKDQLAAKLCGVLPITRDICQEMIRQTCDSGFPPVRSLKTLVSLQRQFLVSSVIPCLLWTRAWLVPIHETISSAEAQRSARGKLVMFMYSDVNPPLIEKDIFEEWCSLEGLTPAFSESRKIRDFATPMKEHDNLVTFLGNVHVDYSKDMFVSSLQCAAKTDTNTHLLCEPIFQAICRCNPDTARDILGNIHKVWHTLHIAMLETVRFSITQLSGLDDSDWSESLRILGLVLCYWVEPKERTCLYRNAALHFSAGYAGSKSLDQVMALAFCRQDYCEPDIPFLRFLFLLKHRFQFFVRENECSKAVIETLEDRLCAFLSGSRDDDIQRGLCMPWFQDWLLLECSIRSTAESTLDGCMKKSAWISHCLSEWYGDIGQDILQRQIFSTLFSQHNSSLSMSQKPEHMFYLFSANEKPLPSYQLDILCVPFLFALQRHIRFNEVYFWQALYDTILSVENVVELGGYVYETMRLSNTGTAPVPGEVVAKLEPLVAGTVLAEALVRARNPSGRC